VKLRLGPYVLLALTLGLFLAATASAQTVPCEVSNSCPKAGVPGPSESPQVGQARAIPQAPKPPQPGLLDKVGDFFGAVGKGIGDGASAVGDGVSATFVGVGALLVVLLTPLADLFVALRPSGVPMPVWAGLAAGSTTAAATGAQAGGYFAWKKLFPLGLGLFSRIDKDELLENDRRARIFELIKHSPGVHLSEIARELDFAWGTTLHHLRKLRADRLIMFKEIGHHKSFFVNGSGLSETQMQAMSLIKNGTLSKLAGYLEEHPRTSLKELSEALQISPPLAAFHIRKLEKAGLVQKVRDGKSVRLTTTSALPAGFLRGLESTTAAPETVGAAS
jgi:Mn-dependent DtxR family transcriptional regulator